MIRSDVCATDLRLATEKDCAGAGPQALTGWMKSATRKGFLWPITDYNHSTRVKVLWMESCFWLSPATTTYRNLGVANPLSKQGKPLEFLNVLPTACSELPTQNMTLLNEWTDSEAYPMPNDVPRGYQTEVFERAQKGICTKLNSGQSTCSWIAENIIAALNTGSGKTLISLLLIRYMTAKSSSNGKLVVFLVPKVTLVEQQYQYLRKRTTPLRINKFYGAADTMPSFTDRPRWKLILDNTEVLVLTGRKYLLLQGHFLWIWLRY